MIFRLTHEQARQRAAQAVLAAPAGFVVTIKEPTRSLEQNAKIHAALSQVGSALEWRFNGQAVDLEDLKTIFMAAYRKASGEQMRFAVGLDGQPVVLNWRTRDLSKKEGAEFIEMVEAWLAEKGK